MTTMQIEPGPCNFTAVVSAQMNDDDMAVVSVSSGCKAVCEMMAALGEEYDPYEVCLVKPGQGPLFAYASEHFPLHAGCPVIAGITKCIEAEAGLALKQDVTAVFLHDEEAEANKGLS